jgi:hypothetical protein
VRGFQSEIADLIDDEQFGLVVSRHQRLIQAAHLLSCFGQDLQLNRIIRSISECLALRWSDVNWLNDTLRIERDIVEQNVDDAKTDGSRKFLAIGNELWSI